MQWQSAVVTFYPHPRTVLNPDKPAACLATIEQRQQTLEKLGLDLLLLLPFTQELANLTAEEFVSELLCKMDLKELWIGADFAMGRGREGSIPRLQAMGAAAGLHVRVVEQLLDGGQPISSTRIRQELGLGHIREANRLMGHRYTVAAEVIPGHQRGRELGFRTANLKLDPQRALPPDGVYAVWAYQAGQPIPGVANLGVRPSFDLNERLLEVHLLDYAGDLYGTKLEIAFVQHLRPEIRFESKQALISQIALDTATARDILGNGTDASEELLSCQEGLKN